MTKKEKEAILNIASIIISLMAITISIITILAY